MKSQDGNKVNYHNQGRKISRQYTEASISFNDIEYRQHGIVGKNQKKHSFQKQPRKVDI